MTTPSLTDIQVTGPPYLMRSPGEILVDIANGPPFIEVGLSLDSGPVIVRATLDENGAAYSVSVPIETTVGTHTLHVSNV